MKKNQNIYLNTAISVFVSSLLLSACSGIQTGEVLDEQSGRYAAESGSGFFSGQKGGWTLGGSKAKKESSNATAVSANTQTQTPKSLDGQTLQQTSETLEDRIQRLERDKIELELLKREIDKKLAK